jgi:ADP-heptose:LPS heptosyltransferase
MAFLDSINRYRRHLMRGLTKNIGASANVVVPIADINDIKRILVVRPNHRLGNLLLITPMLQEIENIFQHATIDLFVKGDVAPTLFTNYKSVKHYISLPRKPFSNLLKYVSGWISIKYREYDIVINLSDSSSSGRLSTKFANSNYKFFGVEGNSSGNPEVHLAKSPVYKFREYLKLIGVHVERTEILPLNIRLTRNEIAEGRILLGQLIDRGKETICIFTYATGRKCYSAEWWEVFYARLKSEFQHHNIIEVLPMEKISMINFKAPTFYSDDVRKIASLIANANIFIGADSGIMHLANAAQTPTVGLFSVTKAKKYQPYGNNSIGIDTNLSSTDECIEIVKGVLESQRSRYVYALNGLNKMIS